MLKQTDSFVTSVGGSGWRAESKHGGAPGQTVETLVKRAVPPRLRGIRGSPLDGRRVSARGDPRPSTEDPTPWENWVLPDPSVAVAVKLAVNRSTAQVVAGYSALTHKRVLHVIEDLDDAALRERSGRANSIGFNLWHIARWADWLQAQIAGTRGEDKRSIWEREGLPGRWGWDSAKLGASQTGMGMDEGVSAQLELPPKTEIERYARASFSALEESIAGLDEETSGTPLKSGETDEIKDATIGSWTVSILVHANRHLGMIEAAKGASGRRGTASV